MADDLRDKIAEALEVVTMAAAPAEPAAAQSRVAVVPSPAAFTAILDAVLTVVGPELERLRKDMRELLDAEQAQYNRRLAAEAERDALKAAIKQARAAYAIHRVAHPAPVGGCAACHMYAALGTTTEETDRDR